MPLIIFAKKNTTEKAIVFCQSNSIIIDTLKKLNAQNDGDWIRVDELKLNETLYFKDDFVYKGYSPKFERYVERIEVL